MAVSRGAADRNGNFSGWGMMKGLMLRANGRRNLRLSDGGSSKADNRAIYLLDSRRGGMDWATEKPIILRINVKTSRMVSL